MDYYFHDNRIMSCYLVNNIGVDIDYLLHFDKHINRIVAKDYSGIGLLLRAFVSIMCTFQDKIILHISDHVLNMQQICMVFSFHVNGLDRVRRYFTKWIVELQDLFKQERLNVLNLETLKYFKTLESVVWSNRILQSIS